jgi:hypothetical protein
MSPSSSLPDFSEGPIQAQESDGSKVAFQRSFETTLTELFVGARVCVRGRPRTCGEVVRIVPMMGRVVVRLDPPHANWRGRLRSFRPDRLVIYS